MKRDLEHDRQSGWRIDANTLGVLIISAFAVAFILALAWLQGCTHAQAKTAADQEKCLAAADAWLHAQILERCNTPNYEECPDKAELDAAWERKARACR